MNKPRIKILQYMHGQQEYFSWSEKINQSYCHRHGYDYVISRVAPRKDRHVVWQKLEAILEELYGCDYLLYVDADAFFYSHELRIEEEFIPLMADKSILMASDIASEKRRWNPKKPNSGVMLMKPNDFVKEFYRFWNEVTDTQNSVRWNWPPTQNALWNFVLPQFPEAIQLCKEYYLIQGEFGMFIRHLMLASDAKRTETMKEFCQKRNIQ